ncbi:hypothetical protein [Methylocapsa sp. S129]|uniref:hypothetical protein n=1 Tax=Methylocapsa sp. S129 TaxID=1641869 RepID=UPI00131B8C99|nr:hypothetical protein [Methylocapsa sp. S129]
MKGTILAGLLVIGAVGAAHAQEDEYEAGKQAFHNYEARPDTTDGYSGYNQAQREEEAQRKAIDDAMHPHVTPAPSYSYQAPAQQQPTSGVSGSVAEPGGSNLAPTVGFAEPSVAQPNPVQSKPADVRTPLPGYSKPRMTLNKPHYRQCPPSGCGPNVPAIVRAIVFNGLFDLMTHRARRHW